MLKCGPLKCESQNKLSEGVERTWRRLERRWMTPVAKTVDGDRSLGHLPDVERLKRPPFFFRNLRAKSRSRSSAWTLSSCPSLLYSLLWFHKTCKSIKHQSPSFRSGAVYPNDGFDDEKILILQTSVWQAAQTYPEVCSCKRKTACNLIW